MMGPRVALSASVPVFPAFIGLLTELNLGSKAMGAGTLFLLAWYVLRAARIGSSIASISATVIQIVVSVFIVSAIAVGLGWVNPQAGVFFGDARTALAWMLDVGVDLAVDQFRRAVEMVS